MFWIRKKRDLMGMNIFDHQKMYIWSPKCVCCEMITKKRYIWSPKILIVKWSPKNDTFDHQKNRNNWSSNLFI
jgi:hypothetical protein